MTGYIQWMIGRAEENILSQPESKNHLLALPGIEPGPLAYRLNALPVSSRGGKEMLIKLHQQ